MPMSDSRNFAICFTRKASGWGRREATTFSLGPACGSGSTSNARAPMPSPVRFEKVADSRRLQAVLNGSCYEMIIWWSDEDAAYVVEVPELPGCMAHGKTRPEAIRQAEAAIRLWIRSEERRVGKE